MFLTKHLTHLDETGGILPQLADARVHVLTEDEKLMIDCSRPGDPEPVGQNVNTTGPRIWIERLEGRYRVFLHPADKNGEAQDAVLTVDLRDDGTGTVEGHGIKPPKVIKR